MTPREKQICDMYLNTDMLQSEIARDLNVTRGYIGQVLKKNKMPCIKRGIVRVSDEKIKEISDLYLNTNLIESDIAIKCGLRYNTVRRIIKEYHPIVRDRKNSDKQLNNLIKINEDYFETIDTPDKSWLLGFIAGDGCLHADKYLLTIGLSTKDVSVLEKIKYFLESEHVLSYENSFSQIQNKSYSSVKLSISRKKYLMI